MIHELLHDLLMEQNKVNGEWKDDIDLRVDELKANEGRHVYPVCQTSMERTRRKCVNPDCRVSLKAAEKQVQGSNILGTALIAPIRCYQQRVSRADMCFNCSISVKSMKFGMIIVFKAPKKIGYGAIAKKSVKGEKFEF